MKKISTIIQSLLICLAVLTAVPNQDALGNTQETIEKVIERGVLRVGFSSFMPWAMQNKEGEYIGFEIDVARRLAKDIGVELQLVPTNWDGIIPALLSGKFDVVIGGMGATVQRGLSVNFTIPYDYVVMDIIAHKTAGAYIKTFEDLNSENTILALRTGSSAAFFAKAQLPNATIRFFNDEAPAVEEVIAGRAHAFISAKPLPNLMLAKNKDTLMQPFEITSYREPISFAVRKGDLNTLNVFDTWIRQMHGLGWLEERSRYWFKGTEWQKDLTTK